MAWLTQIRIVDNVDGRLENQRGRIAAHLALAGSVGLGVVDFFDVHDFL